jgi:hypothetical protein
MARNIGARYSLMQARPSLHSSEHHYHFYTYFILNPPSEKNLNKDTGSTFEVYGPKGPIDLNDSSKTKT